MTNESRTYKLIPSTFSYGLAAVVLVILTWSMHGSALDGDWRFDDGWLLDFATRFSPSEYFFDPLITRAYSPSNVTPWNPLVYDLNLGLFGLDAEKFYAHHLLTIAVAALATFALLNLVIHAGYALFGAGLFLAGAPVFRVAQELMVGHYIYGLIFSILALYGFVRAVRHQSAGWNLFGVVSYVLATTCKEVFVPLPIVLLFLGEGSWASRFHRAVPFLAWSAVYVAWRFLVLGTVTGGYQRGLFEPITAGQQIARIPAWLFGDGPWGWFGLAILGSLFVVAIARGGIRWSLLLVVLAVVLLPLLALVAHPGLHGPNRYLLVPWWAVAILLAFLLAQLRSRPQALRALVAAAISIVVLRNGLNEIEATRPELDRFDAIYREAMQAPPDTLLVATGGTPRYWDVVLNGARRAKSAAEGRAFSRINILTDAGQLHLVDSNRYRIRGFSGDCSCVTDLDGATPGAKAAPAATPRRSFEHLPFGPPFPPLFEAGGGEVESVQADGNRLSITGWLDMAYTDPEQVLVLVSPGRPLGHRMSAHPMGTAALPKAGFRLDLTYASPDQARSASTSACVLRLSSYSGIALLANPFDRTCDALITDRQLP